MAKSALTQLQDQIEAVRREAFAAGYAAQRWGLMRRPSRAPANVAGEAA